MPQAGHRHNSSLGLFTVVMLAGDRGHVDT